MRLSLLLLPVAALFLFMGCKKDNKGQNACRIISLSAPLANTESLVTYASDGKISKITSGKAANTYVYSGDVTIITSFDSTAVQNRTIVTVNAAGLAANVRYENDGTGNNWSNTAYVFNGDEVVKSVSTSSQNNDSSVSTFQWTDHNLTSSISGTDTSRYEYYTDKTWQAGDYFSVVQMLNGYEILRNKNLLKSSGGTVITYEFASDGKISSLHVTSGSNLQILDLEYQCQ